MLLGGRGGSFVKRKGIVFLKEDLSEWEEQSHKSIPYFTKGQNMVPYNHN